MLSVLHLKYTFLSPSISLYIHVYPLFFLTPYVFSSSSLVRHLFPPPYFFSGAIAITGGQFSDPSLSVVIGSVECSGSESGLLNCSYVTDSDERVSECDPGETAAVTCQG